MRGARGPEGTLAGTSLADLDMPLLDLDRVVVTLESESGEWKVSQLDTL